jgi:hypothetical protein
MPVGCAAGQGGPLPSEQAGRGTVLLRAKVALATIAATISGNVRNEGLEVTGDLNGGWPTDFMV